MTSKQLNQPNYKPIQGFLQFIASNFPGEDCLSDPIADLVDDFVEQPEFNQFPSFHERPARRCPISSLLSIRLFGTALNGYCSIRKQAGLCRHDLRFLKYFQISTSSHQTLYNFQQQCLLPAKKEIFRLLNLYIEQKDSALDTETLFLDGTKLEANAN